MKVLDTIVQIEKKIETLGGGIKKLKLWCSN
jgi:hypothetical protein